MPPKKSNKKISSQPAQPAVEASTSVASVSASPLKDLTNLNFLLQQQQNQFMDNSAISVEQPVSTPPVTTSDTPISTNKLSNRWTSPEIRVLIEEVGKHQQMLQKVKDPREKGKNLGYNFRLRRTSREYVDRRMHSTVTKQLNVYQNNNNSFLNQDALIASKIIRGKNQKIAELTKKSEFEVNGFNQNDSDEESEDESGSDPEPTASVYKRQNNKSAVGTFIQFQFATKGN
ncbi:hypothetical protein C2G38_2165353 [Gigaspora rosea]|uniref:Uncharacterized protein n=1 Tax=Gigaspora rosea TaxID=44941 RepID=A0A397W034_9GLOM|nr:hypothetical protein C2G38_2165353 [Gigaspora rosea]